MSYTNSYMQGFCDASLAEGVNPSALIKQAQWWRGFAGLKPALRRVKELALGGNSELIKNHGRVSQGLKDQFKALREVQRTLPGGSDAIKQWRKQMMAPLRAQHAANEAMLNTELGKVLATRLGIGAGLLTGYKALSSPSAQAY